MYRVTRENFLSLKEGWEELLPQSNANPVFSSCPWQRIWWESFGQEKELLLLAFWDGSRLVGIAPLMKEGETMSLVGGTEVSDYLDIIAAQGHEEGVITALLDYLRDTYHSVLDLHCIPNSSPTLKLLPGLASRVGYRASVEVKDVCPKIDLAPTWEEYLLTLSKKDRHELRRKLRRLDVAGDVRFCSVEDPAELSQALDDFFVLHRASREEKAAFMTPQMEGFFRNASAYFVPRGIQRIFFLEIDGVRVSSTICFDYGEELSLYNSGYDPSYSYYSVGLLLKALCLQEAIRIGKKTYDFLRGDEPYKYDLGGKDFPIYRCTLERPKD